MVKGASCHKICVVVGEMWRSPTATKTKLPEMPNTPKASNANVRLEKLLARGSLPMVARTASKTSEADKKRAHTSVGASTAFKACCAATGSEPQVMVAKSASKKPVRLPFVLSVVFMMGYGAAARRVAGRAKAACTPVSQRAGCFLHRQSCASASIGLSLEAFLAGM